MVPSLNLVWYAAYGSNLSPKRFSTYLVGGEFPGAKRVYRGARDPSPPQATRPHRLAGSIHFGGASPTWGGGVAFLDVHDRSEVHSTAYLITVAQFMDLLSQECRAEEVDLRLPGPGESAHVSDCWYGKVLNTGSVESIPVFTFTHVEPLDPASPTGPYLDVMAEGLRSVHGLAEPAIERYLGSDRPAVDAGSRNIVS